MRRADLVLRLLRLQLKLSSRILSEVRTLDVTKLAELCGSGRSLSGSGSVRAKSGSGNGSGVQRSVPVISRGAVAAPAGSCGVIAADRSRGESTAINNAAAGCESGSSGRIVAGPWLGAPPGADAALQGGSPASSQPACISTPAAPPVRPRVPAGAKGSTLQPELRHTHSFELQRDGAAEENVVHVQDRSGGSRRTEGALHNIGFRVLPNSGWTGES